MNIPKLLFEMLFVGVTMALLGLPVSYAMDAVRGKKIDWWPKHVWGMLIGTAVTAGLYHFIWELLGWNAWYAKNYVPLLK